MHEWKAEFFSWSKKKTDRMTQKKNIIKISSILFRRNPPNPNWLNNINMCEKTLKIGLMEYAENAVNTYSPKRIFDTLELICVNVSENETTTKKKYWKLWKTVETELTNIYQLQHVCSFFFVNVSVVWCEYSRFSTNEHNTKLVVG